MRDKKYWPNDLYLKCSVSDLSFIDEYRPHQTLYNYNLTIMDGRKDGHKIT